MAQWRFARAGGFDQVQLTTGAELVRLRELDQKLWVALACPVAGLEFDERTLALIDTDGDGRVRASELIEAVEWAGRMLTDVERLARRGDHLPLAEIDDGHEEGRQLLAAARRILDDIGDASADRIDLWRAERAKATFEATPFNADGIIVEASAESDESLRRTIADVVACSEPKTDKSGAPGVDGAQVEAFYDAAAARVAWLDARDGATHPLGSGTPAAYESLQAVRVKVDDFFARCRIAAFDPRALAAVNRQEAEYLDVAAADLTVTAEEVRHFPIAMVAPGRALPLDHRINPAWAAAVERLRADVVEPLTEAGDELGEAGWIELKQRFAAYEGWLAAEGGAHVAKLGEPRLRELVTRDRRADVEALVQRDLAAKPVADSLESVERLVRYGRDLLSLANNFVAFRDFYARDGLATFQAGTLYLDERACELCIYVNDAAKHATMAPLSGAYLLYCTLTNAQGATRELVAAMTNGDVDNLMVGRNGVFYDRDGEDWDATVTKVVENPISVRQAFWTPYKRFLRAIERLVADRAAAADEAAAARITGAVDATSEAAKGARLDKPTFDVGVIAALGVAVGGLTAALGALLQAFFGLGVWMPLGVLGLMMLISGPSMAMAWLKLRQRNLGPLLDANGWALNARARLNVPLGESLTQVAELPPGSQRDLRDPYAERRLPWGLLVMLVGLLGLGVAWGLGALDRILPTPVQSATVLGELAPVARPPRDAAR